MLEGTSRMDRFYEELEEFLKEPRKERTWDKVYRKDARRISKHIAEKYHNLQIETKDISISKVKVIIKKKNYVVAGKYDVFLEDNEFKVISRDKRDERYIAISLEKMYNNPSLMRMEKVMELIERETAEFFEEEKVVCYPLNAVTKKLINDIVLFNKREFDSCDSE